MKLKQKILLFTLAFYSVKAWTQTSTDDATYVQEETSLGVSNSLPGPTKSLGLNDVLEQGLRQNLGQQGRNTEKEIVELRWQDTHTSFWFPEIKLQLTTAPQSLGKWRTGSMDNSPYQHTPSGTVGLVMEDYTVFNWGKDHLLYLNAKETYRRRTQQLGEARRALRNSLIIGYFQLNYLQKRESLARDQLRHASFVYRLNKERLSLRKVGRQEFLQIRDEYLNAQAIYQQIKNDFQLANERLALLINDAPGTRYILRDQLKFKNFSYPVQKALTVSEEKSPSVRDAKTAFEISKRLADFTLRENLPLPEFTLDLGAYNHRFGPSQNQTRYETSPGNSSIELVATVNATWSLVGTGGIFNQRKTQSSQLQQQLADIQHSEAKRITAANIQQQYENIGNYERQVKILDARVINLRLAFDTILENYTNQRTTYLDFRQGLNELITREALLEETKFFHMREKVLLAQTVGLDDFPGENFEQLAQPK